MSSDHHAQSNPSRRPSKPWGLALALALALLIPAWGNPAEAKSKKKEKAEKEAAEKAPAVDPARFQGLSWRMVGPYRGGRSLAVTGVVQEPGTFYFGATGGGVWKTETSGLTWENVSDGHFATGSVGAVAVAPSDPNVVYAGMGEACVRGVTTSSGDGVYRSRDAGKTWQHVGLAETLHISSVVVHPDDPDTVYVAAQGNPYQPNPERGIYRSRDGGDSWELVLQVSDDAGASDLVIDPTNPRVLYAAFWEHRRKPWKIESGGPGSGIHKTTDGGDTWKELTAGLPELMGKTAVAVSASRPERVWVLAEAEKGGLYRSDDGGASFRLVNGDRVLQTRAWYYIHVYADPEDADTVYVLNAPMVRSVDGGRTFQPVPTPHGDNHDLWIHPNDSRTMINANDGGANISYDGGRTWSTQANQPTAQFYRVDVDNGFPYKIYGGQQDNSTVAIRAWDTDGMVGPEDWDAVGGCESAHVGFDPDDPRFIYAGCYQGNITEYDSVTREVRDVMAYPVIGLGSVPSEARYRFNWNAPIEVSPHDPDVVYHAAQVLLRSEDRGRTWAEVSPDLTRNEKEKQGPGGGPITSEGAGGEIYNTILYVTLSPHEEGVIWVGTDDGLVHLTRNDGADWQNVTPKGAPEALINAIEVSPHDPATAYLAVTAYKFGDFRPYIYETNDYGASWKRLDGGLPEDHFVRVVREDTERRDLLYAGTEHGVYASFDGGGEWQPLQLNLPVVPVTDLVVHEDDLVAATQGRGFWVLHDLNPLRNLDAKAKKDDETVADFRLYPVPDVHRLRFGQGAGGKGAPITPNPPMGAVIDFYLSDIPGAEVPGAPAPEAEDGEAAPAENDEGEETADADMDTGMDADMDAEMGDGEMAEEEGAPSTEVAIEILDASGEVVRRVSNQDEPMGGPGGPGGAGPGGPPGAGGFSPKAGHNRWVWSLVRDRPEPVEGIWNLGGGPTYRLAPGTYTARLVVGEESAEQTFQVLEDPRAVPASPEDWAEQQAILADALDAVTEVHGSIGRLWTARDQIRAVIERSEEHPAAEEIAEAGEALIEDLEAQADRLVQTKTSNFQDIINYPNKLNMDLLWMFNSLNDSPPVNAGQKERLEDLMAQWAEEKVEVDRLLGEEVAAFNALVAEKQLPAVYVPEAGAAEAGEMESAEMGEEG